jgi:hypothetical protein
MTRIGFVGRRHPLCPWCGYDLVSTVADCGRTGRCPECGETFERHELTWEVLSDDWTVVRGLRRLMLVLLGRSLVAVALWSGLLWALAASVNGLQQHVSAWTGSALGIVAGIVALTAGGVVGSTLARGIEERAGFTSTLIVALTTAHAWVVLWVGIFLSFRLGVISGSSAGGLRSMTCVIAFAFILRHTVFADG